MKRRTTTRGSPPATQSPLGHIAEVTISDFKSLKDATVQLGQVNVFIGANGSGKSCLLEAIGILGACSGGVVDDQALLRRGVRPGVPERYKSSFSGEKKAPKISLSATSTEGALYHAYITNPANNPRPYWLFGNETLKFGGTVVASRGPHRNARALDLSLPLENNRSVTALVRAAQRTPSELRSFLTYLEDFAIFAPVTPVLRGIVPDSAQRNPVGLYGGQLAEAIALLNTQQRGKIAIRDCLSLVDWAKKVSAGEPKRSFVSPSVPTSRIIVEFEDRFMSARNNVLSGYDASEGALYILFMLVLASHTQSPRIMAIDNFDQALNPRTARALTRIFSDHILGTERQALLTSHNPLVLDGLNLADDRIRLFTVRRDQAGHTRIKRVAVNDFEGLKRKHGEHAVSRLWVEGRLGGMPDV